MTEQEWGELAVYVGHLYPGDPRWTTAETVAAWYPVVLEVTLETFTQGLAEWCSSDTAGICPNPGQVLFLVYEWRRKMVRQQFDQAVHDLALAAFPFDVDPEELAHLERERDLHLASIPGSWIPPRIDVLPDTFAPEE